MVFVTASKGKPRLARFRGDVRRHSKKCRAFLGPAGWEVGVTSAAGDVALFTVLLCALRQSRLGKGDCRGADKYRGRFARVNCTNIQFAGNILPGWDCVAEPHNGVAPGHGGEDSNDRRRARQS